MQSQGAHSPTVDPAVQLAAVAAAGFAVSHPTMARPMPSVTRSRPKRRNIDEELQSIPVIEQAFVWRVVNFMLAAVALLFSLPIIAVLAILVRLDSRGPAFFAQPRVGRGGKIFKFVKFRTLYHDARERFPHLYAYDYTNSEIETLCFKITNDPRVTRIGKFLRSSTLDELPNFWHVLTGEMSLVGPRPEIPEMLPYYSTEELVKFAVLPGITGLAQVSGRGLLSFRDTVRLDVAYVRNQSALYDIALMFRTIYCVILRRGAF